MADNLPRQAAAFGLLVVGVGVWYLWSNQGGTHNLNAVDAAYSDLGYYPYAWWVGHGGSGRSYVHHYPEFTKITCMPDPLANENGTLSVAQSEVGNG